MRRLHVRLAPLLLVSAGLGCSRAPAPSASASASASSPPAPAASASSAAITNAGDAGARASAKSTPPNLLQLVPAKVAVSSTVANPRDFPEHLMDGRADTAWNSRTGDLKGAIDFRVPNDAHVDAVLLTVGFDKRSAQGDLFTMNQRVKRVRVSKENGHGVYVAVREMGLDTNERGLQSIPVDASGGDFRVEILETVAGTKPEWRELAISEMRVVGKPGAERRKAGEALRIVVGSLDELPKSMTTVPLGFSRAGAKDVATLCATYVASSKAALAPLRKDLESGMLDATIDPLPVWNEPFCREVPFKGTFDAHGDAKWKSVRAVRAGFGTSDAFWLVAELPRGFVLTPIGWDDKGANPTGCPSVFVASDVPEVRVDAGFLVAVVDGTRVVLGNPPPTGPNEDGTVEGLVRGATWCKDDGTCEAWDPQYQEALAIKTQPSRNGRVPWAQLAWKNAYPFKIGADGVLHPQGR